MLMAQEKAGEAAELLRKAASLNPLPDYQWTLLEALRVAGCPSEAAEVESRLTAQGKRTDPRTFSVYLATQGADVESALCLAKEELQQRQDVLTCDALAWALFANGRHAEAWTAMERALAENTVEARHFLHRAVIAAWLGREGASRWLEQAQELSNLLLPSERRHLEKALVLLRKNVSARTSSDVR
jgi:tetratricopeptide (TPR) repeat protein